MKMSRLHRWIIFGMIAMNLILLYLLVFNHVDRHPPRLSTLLEAEGKEAKLFDAEMQQHRSQIKNLRVRQQTLRILLNHTTANQTAQRTKLFGQIAAAQRQIDSVTIQHFDQVEKLCKPAQLKIFKAFRMRLLNPKHLR